ncbi:MAG: carboxypeptidase regulatory-like domain-containing protein [Candidatus Coatesbacteria bacterium]|nr:carboxypeptidase regulatory-like domain-containing protein [Candidatus Coatesbacteria bacterium]
MRVYFAEAAVAASVLVLGTLSMMAGAAPTVTIFTDRGTHAAGDTIEVSLGGENNGGGMFVAVYVGLLTPDGRLFTFREGTWPEDALPWIDVIYVPDAFNMEPTALWWLSIPSSTPPIGDLGRYSFAAGLTSPGASEFVSDTSFAPFDVAAGQATVEGRVCEAGTETAIEGAQVYIGQIWDITDADGLYLLEGVPLGEHTTNAEFPGFERYEEAIRVVEGSNIHHIYMTPSTQITNLRGVVTDFADAPVAGVRVDIAGRTAYTDGAGHFEFLGLTQGAYNLRVSGVACYDNYSAEIELNAADMTHDVRLSLSALPAPSGFAASTDAFLLNSLSWDPVECAVRYNVHVSNDAGASSTLLGQVSPPETSCQHSLDSNCSDLWYSLASIGLDGREAERTQWAQVSPIRTLQLDTDTTLSGELCFEESLVVPQQVVLTVAPGSALRFAEGCGIDVYGGLMALGDVSSGIVIEGFGGTAAWEHVAFHDTSDPQSCKLSYVTIQGGTAEYGGAIYCDGASPTIEHCTITSNTASLHGGGIFCYENVPGHSPIIFNNLIVDNLAYVESGGVCTENSSPRMNNNTIAYNTGYGGGDGICDSSPPGPTIFDCIFWGNAAEDIHGCSFVTYSCIEGGHAGVGNMQNHPLFDGPFGCYYLAPTSPCIDAGSQSAENAGVSKRTTQLDNTPDTGTVDMGYHYPIPTE